MWGPVREGLSSSLVVNRALGLTFCTELELIAEDLTQAFSYSNECPHRMFELRHRGDPSPIGLGKCSSCVRVSREPFLPLRMPSFSFHW